MAEARGRAAWRQTSLLAALVANQNATKRHHLKQPRDFDPYRRRTSAGSARLTPANIHNLKAFLTHPQGQ